MQVIGMKNTEIKCVKCEVKYPPKAINPKTGLCPLCDNQGTDHPYIQRLWF